MSELNHLGQQLEAAVTLAKNLFYSACKPAEPESPHATDPVQGFQRLLACTNPQDIQPALEQLVHGLGFDHYLYALRMRFEGGRATDHVITDYPTDWVRRYHERQYIDIDPVVLHCTRHVVPIVWSADLFVGEREQALYQEGLAFGLGHGISIPVHGHRGEAAMLTLTIEADCPLAARRFLGERAALAQQLACYAHEALRHCLLRKFEQFDVRLTPREVHCLGWVARGKTTWETAQILQVSEHAITHHLRNVMRKLQVTSRHQAVQRAVSLGLLEL